MRIHETAVAVAFAGLAAGYEKLAVRPLREGGAFAAAGRAAGGLPSPAACRPAATAAAAGVLLVTSAP
ncbi:hypothetical protein [Streptomyces montanus]|uniref:hypothetical protein n=1 Tax=Streptomyces montanus TaxID=2580423 RepID=UPI003CCC63B6